MATVTIIDPVTRLEGHLKIKVTVDTVNGVQQVSRTDTLGPLGSTTFVVAFMPLGTGARSCTIHIASDDADENPYGNEHADANGNEYANTDVHHNPEGARRALPAHLRRNIEAIGGHKLQILLDQAKLGHFQPA